MKPVHSTATVETYRKILDRKSSIQEILRITADGLSNVFARDQKTPEQLVYDLFKLPNKNEASIGKLVSVLRSYGLRDSDPRLQPMMARILEIEHTRESISNEVRDPKHWKMNRKDFTEAIAPSIGIISRTLQNNLVIPSWGPFCSVIKEIYEKCRKIDGGSVATYIPQLARQNANCWGVSICTVDGQRFSIGDATTPFCIQSVSKAFNYAIAASRLGEDSIHRYVGQEPSGRLFNEICLDSQNRPHNPMVNAGAIVVSSLIERQLDMADRFDYVLNEYRKISGGEYVGFNNAVFLSERSTANRNKALAYYMKENKCFPPEIDDVISVLDFYFQLCSLETTCESMAVMSATLANGGVCPTTEEKCIESRPTRDVLSLMYSCGMYDYSGQFSFHVGLPAKSGVSGAMIVVIPNVMGICLWSPSLDALGNSVRGVAFCKELINRFNFHNYDSLAHTGISKIDPRKRQGDKEKDQVISLLFAARSGDLNTIRRIYLQGVNLDVADYDGRTPLHLASSEGHVEVVKFLLYTGRVKVAPQDRWKRTPLDDAAYFGNEQLVSVLKKAITLSDEDGKIAFNELSNMKKAPTAGQLSVDRLSIVTDDEGDEDDEGESESDSESSEYDSLLSSVTTTKETGSPVVSFTVGDVSDGSTDKLAEVGRSVI